MWCEVLNKEDAEPFFDAFRRIDAELYEVFGHDFLVVYSDKNFTGKNVITMIADNKWIDLVDLDGVNASTLYTWNGAYKTRYLMFDMSSCVTLFTYPEFYCEKPI
jgi:hypothetical protein